MLYSRTLSKNSHMGIIMFFYSNYWVDYNSIFKSCIHPLLNIKEYFFQEEFDF